MMESMEMAEVLRTRRAELGMSQAELAAAAGVDKRQIRRYEAGEQQPVLSVAVAIANALKISVGELAGMPSHRVNLTGDWWASWQTSKDGEEVITAQEVQFRQQTELISVQTTTRGIEVEDGGYHWRGELRLWDNEILMGWYAAADGSVRSKGTMYFVLHPHGQSMRGRWVGVSYDGKIVTGWGGMARSEEEARSIIDGLKQGTTAEREPEPAA
jgi:transcriptional regulator with XRE-family HTH domain